MTSTPDFQPTCPSGGTWYACGNGTQFTGCCTTYACTDNGCFQGNLRPASFPAASYGTFPDQQCDAGSWYTCTASNPPFVGCCASNPCQPGGCPTSDLRSGHLSSNSRIANAFDPQPPLSDSGAASSTSTSTTTSTATSGSTSSDSQPTSNGKIIGGALAGGIVALFLLIGLALYVMHRRRHAKSQSQSMHSYLYNKLSPSLPDPVRDGSATDNQTHKHASHSSYSRMTFSPVELATPPTYSWPTASTTMAGTPELNFPHEVENHEISSTTYSPPHSAHLAASHQYRSTSALRNSGDIGLGVSTIDMDMDPRRSARYVSGNSELERAELY